MYLVQVAAVGYKSKSGGTFVNTNTLIDQTLTTSSPMSSKDKSSSLPGYGNRGFHETYSGSHAVSSYQSPPAQPTIRHHQDQWADKANKIATTGVADPSPPAQSQGNKKKKWPGWSGFFRRNKASNHPTTNAPPVALDGNSSDETVGQLAKSHHAHQHVALAHPSEDHATTTATVGGHHHHHPNPKNNSRFHLHPPRNVSKDRSPLVDTLSPLQSDWSSSQTSLSRKERRDAILARAQARRNGSAGGSSSEDEGVVGGGSSGGGDSHLLSPSPSRMHRRRHHSQESLTSNGSSSRTGGGGGHPKSRTGRTERYMQRRSRDEESLRREQQQQQMGSPSCADQRHLSPAEWSAVQLNSSRRWAATATSSTSSMPGSNQRLGESPVTFRNPNSYGSQNSMNNINSPAVGRAQSVLATHPKLSTPPPPPPRNPLKKSYLLQVQSGGGGATSTDAERHFPHPGRPTSYSFVELARFGQQQQHHHHHHHQLRQQQHPSSSSLHDYQNVDQNGREVMVPPAADHSAMHLPLTSPVQRRVFGHPSQPNQQPRHPGSSRHHSAIFPTTTTQSPSPSYVKTPEQERIKPPWLSGVCPAKTVALASPPPVREFWRSKEAHQAPPVAVNVKSARERLAVGSLHHQASNGSVKSGDLSSPLSRDALTTTTSSGDVPATTTTTAAAMTASPFYVAVTGNALANNSVINSSPVLSTPKRIPAVLYNNNNNNSNNQQGHEAQHHVRELSQLKPSTDRHLEQAICELEQIYRSLKLDGDEDLLDRAERRDLPTAHQQLSHQHQQLAQQHPVYPFSGCSGSESGGDPLGGHGITSDLDTMMNWSISGSFENLAANPDRPRVRTPSSRRSAVPDKVADDMAVRRLAAAGRKSQVNDPQMIAAQSGSYLLLSPSVTAAEDHQPNDGSSRSGSSPDEPDIVYDDVAYRHIRQVNQSLRVAEPQPFGIPLGPVTPASPSDYLHTCVTPEKMELRPLLHPTKYPDLIRDDLAFRNLRKDAGQVQLPLGPVNTDKLDDLLQETGFSSKTLKKKRAVRSLSANIAQLIRKDAARPSGGGGVVDFNKVDDEEEDERYISLNPFDSRAQSLSDLLDESASSVYNNNNNNVYVAKLTAKTPRAVKQRSGLKRNVKASETDETDALIVQRQVRPTASWVERAHLSDAPATVTANSNSEAICSSAERVPALAKLFPTSALLPAKKFDQIGASDRGSKEDLEMDHLIAELSVAGESSGVGLESSALKPPTGICATGEVETSSPAGHYWEESPLFQSQPQFTFASATTRRSVSPANSSDSGQVSCCAREVRQILHHQIRQEEIERERLASSGRKTSRTADPAAAAGQILASDKTTPDRSAASKGRSVQSAATPTHRDNPVVRKSSGRRMSNNNDTAANAAVDKRDERIARYKEERRKQLQARHQVVSAMVERSSSSEDLPHEEQSYAKYKHRKQMQKQQLESRPAEDPSPANSSDVANSNAASSTSGIKRFIKRDSPLSEENNGGGITPVRTNRAARLRAAAASGTPPPPAEEKSVVPKIKRLSVPTLEQASNSVSDAPTDLGDQNVVPMRSKAPSSSPSTWIQNSREKDKSTKRKSNLNRALTDEQILSAGQPDCQDDAGKRIRRRRTGELAVSASSAETDMSSSVDNTIQRPSPQPGVDLRAHLRKTSQPPAFIRPPDAAADVSPIPSLKEKSPSPGPSVPWRTGKVSSNVKSTQPEPIKTEDLTARIEALTAIAHQTVAKVDRLTATTPTSEPPARPEVNGATPSTGGSVKAVATKLLNQVQPKPVSPLLNVGRRPVKMESPVAGLVTSNSVSSPSTPFVKPTQQQQQQHQQQHQPTGNSKNRPNDGPMDKTPTVQARANTLVTKVFGRNVGTTQTNAAANKPVASVDNSPSGVPSTVKTVQGILKKKVEGTDPTKTQDAILTGASESYPILRVDEEPIAVPSDPVSILKKRFEEAESTAASATERSPALAAEGSPETHHSILKRSLSRDGSAESGRSQSPVDPLNSILKRTALNPSPSVFVADHPASSDPRPILKKKSLTDDPFQQLADSPRPILKKRSSTDDENESAAHRPILKSGRRTSSEQPDLLDNHLSKLRRPEARESPPPVGANEPSDVTNQPEEERSVEERQLSVAERISCMESQNQPAIVAPWRLPSHRPPTVSLPKENCANSSIVDPPESFDRRRKSLDVNQTIDSNRITAGLEAVNRHVVSALAHNQTQPDPAVINPSQTEEEEFDPSKLSLKERMKLFDRPPIRANAAHSISPPRPRHRKAIAARFLTQPITIREMEKARSREPSTAVGTTSCPAKKPPIPAIEVKQETVTVDNNDEDQTTESSGLERIRGILRRKSSETPMETKGILRSKSPSTGSANGSDHPPKSILKRPSPDADERPSTNGDTNSSSGSGSSSSADLVVAAENNLAAQLLHVEQEAKNLPTPPLVDPLAIEETMTTSADTAEETDTPESIEEASGMTDQHDSSPLGHQHSVRRETTETIIVESEGNSSGTETTTTVTFRLGGAGAGSTSIKQSQTKIKNHKVNVMEELGETSLASRPTIEPTRTADLDESEDDGDSSSSAEVKTTVSLRLAALQKSGDNDWRKRISKPSGSSATSPATELEEATNSDGDIPSKSSIADRLKVLESAQKTWRNRVHEPDAARFTVAGKMGQRPASIHVVTSDGSSPVSPLLERKKKIPKALPFRVKASDGSAASDSSPGTPSTDNDVKPPFNRSTSDPNGIPSKTPLNIKMGSSKVTSRIVSVPRPDDETFTSFFTSSSWSLATSQSVSTVVSSSSFSEMTAEDFDQIVISRDLVVEKRAVHVQRRKNNASRNPIKSLILRSDMLRDEYEEVDTGVAEREVQRIKLEQLAKSSHLAVEALAGLASKEDFSSIALKSAKQGDGDHSGRSMYLMQIKGRRQIQTRLVEPVYTSVNSGDCFILVTLTDVIQFVGRYSNVIERARSSEVAQRILLKKDLGSLQASQVQLIEEDKIGCDAFFGPSKRFWNALGRTEPHQPVHPAGPPEEDELYESAITSTNTVWQLDGDHLEPCEQHWGTILQTDILDPNKVMVFDFGSEMFVWSGKMAPLESRKMAMQLAKELWNQGYDYTECVINPIFQRPTGHEQSKGSRRPEWTLLKAAKQHMEPVLFREKFFDWPDKSGLIKIKRQESEEKPVNVADISSLEPYDAQLMVDNELEDPDLELEGSHLGRGVEYYDEAERRLQQISTLNFKVWHLLDYEKVLLDEVSRGQFHCRDTYIIRWQYRITVTGKDLKGQPSVHGLLGRDRFCYFIWHGAQAPSTDQGASALKTVELDEERGPHVRVQQGHEPPAFLAVFQGRMAVHSGKRGESNGNETGWRLYFVRGEKEEEAHLLQVERCVQALRSRGCLLLINQSTGTIFLWHGAKSHKHTRQVAASAAAALKQHRPPELNVRAGISLTIKEQYEGAESREFWEGLGHNSRVADRSLYLSLAEQPKENRYDYTPRLFHLTSWTGQFRADEVAPTSRFPSLPCPYPFVQEELYSANQPTLFMLDNEHDVWLWQGWWPDQPDSENTNTGSGKLRLAVERRCAMETVIEYCRLKADQRDGAPPPAYLVSAGLEPMAFTALFPYWTVDEHVGKLNIQDGKSPCEMQSIQDVLDRLKRTTYSLNELQERPPPEGVDPTRLESYLNDDDFQETMNMTKPEFYALPAWRQSQLRKETGLF